MISRIHAVVLTGPNQSFADDWAAAVSPFVRVTLIRTHSYPGSRDDSTERASDMRPYTISLPSLRPTRVFANIQLRLWLSRFMDLKPVIERERGPIHLFHGHFYSVSHRLLALKRATGIPFVLTEHSSRLTGRSARHKPLSSRGYALAQEGYRQAATVIFVSRYLRDCARAMGLEGSFDVIGNPVKTDIFAPSGRRADPRRRIVWVGRLEADKNPALLLHAFADVRRRDPGIVLDVIGDGPDRQQIEALARSLDMNECTTFHGRLSRPAIAEVFARSSVFVSTSRVETFGLALAEAGAAGLPLIAPDMPSVRELFGPYVHPYTRGNSLALAESLIRVLHKPPGTAPQVAYVRRRFDPDVIGGRLAAIYARTKKEESLAGAVEER